MSQNVNAKNIRLYNIFSKLGVALVTEFGFVHLVGVNFDTEVSFFGYISRGKGFFAHGVIDGFCG